MENWGRNNIVNVDINNDDGFTEPSNEHYKIKEEREYIRRKFNNLEEVMNLKMILANNIDTYLKDCRYLISEKIIHTIPEHDYHVTDFEKLTDWEILEYRYLLEKDVEKGIYALNQIQLMEMLIQERKQRRFPQYVYQMGTTNNVANIIEGLAFALNLRNPTPLLIMTQDKIRQCYEGKPYDPRETVLSKRQLQLTMLAEALQSVKGCELHREGEMGDLTCRFKHLSIRDNNHYDHNIRNVFSL